MREGKGRVLKLGGSLTIRIEHAVASDSTFPFKEKEEVKVRVADHKVVVEKLA